MPDGYWFCEECRREIAENNLRDVTFDQELVDYLRMGTLPVEEAAQKRVQAASEYMRWE